MKKGYNDEPVIVSGFHHGVPPLRFCQVFVWTGIVSVVGALCAGSSGWRPSESGPFSLGLLFFGVLFLGIGGTLLQIRKSILRLLPAEKLCEQMGMDELALYQVAETQGVRPRFIVNGREYYDPADFSTPSQLLRASQSPAATPDTLLRPAQTSAPQEADLLLRQSGAHSSQIIGRTERGFSGDQAEV